MAVGPLLYAAPKVRGLAESDVRQQGRRLTLAAAALTIRIAQDASWEIVVPRSLERLPC